jgi:hypothetical protein
MAPPTANQRLASLLLGQPVDQWLTQRRESGRSWRLIARDLYDATNGQVDMTYEALRRWLPEDAA